MTAAVVTKHLPDFNLLGLYILTVTVLTMVIRVSKLLLETGIPGNQKLFLNDIFAKRGGSGDTGGSGLVNSAHKSRWQ
jgi:hypothetical protein